MKYYWLIKYSLALKIAPHRLLINYKRKSTFIKGAEGRITKLLFHFLFSLAFFPNPIAIIVKISNGNKFRIASEREVN